VADARQYELADFEPSDGHLHDCPVRTELYPPDTPDWLEARPALCDCASHLYAVAARAEVALYQVQTYAEGNVSAAGSRTLGHLLHVINLCEQARG
jgi:hypothetical protein